MSTSGTTTSAGTTATGGRGRRRRLAVGAATVSAVCLLFAGCTSAPDGTAAPAGGTSSAAGGPASGTASGTASPAADALVVRVAEADGEVTPNGQKLEARVGQQVVLDVTSDQDDEIHAHIGGEGYELEVKAGEPATGTFTRRPPAASRSSRTSWRRSSSS